MKIGNKIFNKRIEKGITGKELSLRAGVSQSTISDIEKDKRSPQLNTLEKICESLDIDMIELLADQKIIKKLRDDEALILNFFNKLTPKEKESLIQFLKLLLERTK